MTKFFVYPEAAKFGRVVPKSKIYEHGRPDAAKKELFVRQVEQIVWQYKLAPETIHIKGTPSVPEIQIFSIRLKDGELSTEVLRCIDQAIPFPIIFELRFEGRVKSIAAYKRPSETDANKRVISEYFDGDWVEEETTKHKKKEKLPLTMDLGQLYDRILEGMIPFSKRPEESMPTLANRVERIRLKQRELERCEARLRKEKQFNRKIGINAEVRDLKQELEGLIS